MIRCSKLAKKILCVVITSNIVMCIVLYHDSTKKSQKKNFPSLNKVELDTVTPEVGNASKVIDKLSQTKDIYYSLKDAVERMKSLTIEDTNDIFINYRNYSSSLPRFESEDDLKLFLKSKVNHDALMPPVSKTLHGEINVVRNGTFKMFYECGWRSDVSYLREKRVPVKSYKYLVPLIVPMAFLFQHFMDGTLPKVIQAYEFIRRPEVFVLLEKPFHASIHELLAAVNISEDKIIWHNRNDAKTVYHAEYMIFTCITPPLHPDLWTEVRHLLGVKEDRERPWHEGKVMLLTRAGSTAGGRRIINQPQLLDYLQERFGVGNVLLFSGRYSLQEAKTIFSDVRIMLGPHGGAFYNMMYAPRDTVVVEFGPVPQGGGDIPSLPHAIFWRIANLIGQPYWRIPIVQENSQNDMVVDLDKLTRVLDSIEGVKS